MKYNKFHSNVTEKYHLKVAAENIYRINNFMGILSAKLRKLYMR